MDRVLDTASRVAGCMARATLHRMARCMSVAALRVLAGAAWVRVERAVNDRLATGARRHDAEHDRGDQPGVPGVLNRVLTGYSRRVLTGYLCGCTTVRDVRRVPRKPVSPARRQCARARLSVASLTRSTPTAVRPQRRQRGRSDDGPEGRGGSRTLARPQCKERGYMGYFNTREWREPRDDRAQHGWQRACRSTAACACSIPL